jgi:hypothetical protein
MPFTLEEMEETGQIARDVLKKIALDAANTKFKEFTQALVTYVVLTSTSSIDAKQRFKKIIADSIPGMENMGQLFFEKNYEQMQAEVTEAILADLTTLSEILKS